MADFSDSKSKHQRLSDRDLELNVFDLDGLEDPFDTDILSNPKDQSAALRFFHGFRRSIFDKSLAKQQLRSVLVGALPDGYQQLYQASQTARHQIAADFNSLKANNPQTLLSLIEKTERVLPYLKTRAPKRLYSRLEDRLQAARRDLEADLQFGSTTHLSQEEKDSRTLLEGLKELEVQSHARREHFEQEMELRRAAESTLKDQVSLGRFTMLFNRLGLIANTVANTNQYQERITYKFQRKSLELQYRTYFALRDLKQMTAARMLLEQQEFIRRNPELAGTVRGSARDALAAHDAALGAAGGGSFSYGAQVKRQFTNKVVDRVSKFLPGYLQEYYPNLRQNILGAAARFLENLDQLTGQIPTDGFGGMDRATVLGTLAGSGVGEYAGSALAPVVARFLKPTLNRYGDKAGGQHHLLAYYLNNFPALLQEYTQDMNQSGWRGVVQNFVRSVAPSYYLDDKIESGSYQSIDRDARFNQLTQRSIVDIIPGYLSRILHEARIARTGNPALDMEVYDITRGKFTGFKEAQRAIQGRLVSERKRREISDTLDDVVRAFDQDEQLSAEARDALRERMLRDAATNKRFDPSRYASGMGYGEQVNEATLRELSEFFTKKFDLDADGNIRADAQTRELLNRYSNAFLALRDVVPDPRREIRRLMGAGSQELVRQLGLINTTHGQDRINYDRMFELYRGTEIANEDLTQQVDERPEPTPEKKKTFKEKIQERVELELDRRFGPATPTDPEPTSEDVYKPGETAPVITAREFKLGTFFDAMTGKVIKGWEDITGAVKDRWGRVVLREEDVAAGLVTQTGKKVKTGADKARQRRKLTELKKAKEALKNAVQEKTTESVSHWKDLFTKKRDRVILARDMKEGKYIDVNTKRVIQSIDDITGEVKDVDGNVVLTDAEFAEGLTDQTGQEVQGSFKRRFLKSYFKTTTLPARKLFSIAANVTWGVGKFAMGILTRQRDAYLEGEETPILTVKDIKAGKYFDAKGRSISSINDIHTDVYDQDGNLVLAKDQLRDLRTIDGRKHNLAKRFRTLRRASGAIGRGMGKAAGFLGRAWWKFTKAYYRGLGKFVGKRIGKTINRIAGANVIPAELLQTSTDHILARVHGTMDSIRDMMEHLVTKGEGPRKGSWQELMTRKKETPEAKSETKAKEKEGDSFLKKLTKSLGGLFGLGGEGSDGDSGDTFIDLGGGGADKDGKKPSNKTKNPKGPNTKGRWGRIMDRVKDVGSKVKDSRVGQWVSRAWNSKAGMALRTVGSWAMKPVGWLARGALAAGSALLTALSSPVVLTAAAVAGVAAAGYGAYRYLSNRGKVDGVFAKLRVTQYGYSPNGWSAAAKIMDMEAELEQAVIRTPGQPASVDTNKVDPQRLFEIMGIDPEENAEVAGFVNWFETRFRPIWLAYHTALTAHTTAGSLAEMESGMTAEQAMRVLEMVKFPYTGDTPYAYMQSAFDIDDTVDTDIDDIKEREQDVVEHYKGKEKQSSAVKANKEKSGAASKDGKEVGTSLAALAATTGGVTPPGVSDSGVKLGSVAVSKQVQGTTARGTAVSIGAMAAAATLTGTKVAGNTGGLQPLELIRLAAYGVDGLHEPNVSAVLRLERDVFAGLTQKNGELYLAPSDLDYWAQNYGRSLGFEVDDVGSKDLVMFLSWFQNRFIEAVRAYASAVWNRMPSADLTNAVYSLSKEDQVGVAEALLGLTTTYQGQSMRLFAIPELLGSGVTVGQLESLAREQLKLLSSEEYKPAQGAASGGTTRHVNNEPMTAQQRALARWNLAPTQTVVIAGGNAGLIAPYKPGGQVTTRGSVYGGVKQGTGGAWTSIPMPRSNKSKEGALPTLEAVSAMTGVDLGLLVTFCSIESNFDYQVRNKLSSATGWFQFIDSTWDEMIKKYGGKYGIGSDPMRMLRLDPRVNALMGAEFLKANYEYLLKELGRAPTDTDLYLAHFMGPGGAVKFLRQDTNAIAAQVFPEAAKANPTIFFTPSGQPRTIGEVYALMDEKVGRHRYGEQVSVSYPGTTTAPETEPGLSDPGPLPMIDETGHKPKATTSVGQMVAGTVAPGMQGATGVLPSVAGMAEAEGEETTTMRQQQEAAKRQAAAADKRQQAVAEQQMAFSKEMGHLMAKQLEVQVAMRDYLREIAATFGAINEEGLKVRGEFGTSQASNDTSRPSPSATRTRPAANTPAPVSTKRG